MAADATNIWNSKCAVWEFPQAPLGSTATFGDAWAMRPHALTYDDAIAGITAEVNQAMGATVRPPSTGDAFNALIQNWQ